MVKYPHLYNETMDGESNRSCISKTPPIKIIEFSSIVRNVFVELNLRNEDTYSTVTSQYLKFPQNVSEIPKKIRKFVMVFAAQFFFFAREANNRRKSF